MVYVFYPKFREIKHASVGITQNYCLTKKTPLPIILLIYGYTGSAQTSLLVNYCHLLDLSADPKL